MALVYLSGPWQNILALLQYFKIVLFQITNNTNLTLPNQSNNPYPNPVGSHQRPPSAALKFLVFEVLKFDARLLFLKVNKIW